MAGKRQIEYDILGDLAVSRNQPFDAYDPPQPPTGVSIFSGSYEQALAYQQKARTSAKAEITQGVIDEIVARTRAGEILADICRDSHLPHHEAIQRFMKRPENAIHHKAYVAAKHDMAQTLAEATLTVSCNLDIDTGRAKMIVSTLQWMAAKLDPKRYGDKVEHSVMGDADNPIFIASENIDLKSQSTDYLMEVIRAAASPN